MKNIESFLQSKYYIGFIFMITLITWSFNWETPPYAFNVYNMIIVYSIIFMNAFVLCMFKNTLYSIPLVFSLLFIINENNISFDNTNELGFPMISFLTFLVGYSVYFIRFRPKFKIKRFTLGLFLIALSYVIPLIYTPFSLSAITVSSLGFVYLFLYLFYANTTDGNLKYLFTLFLAINLLLVYQVGYYILQGYILNPHLSFAERITVGWGRNFGWGNVNDICFYIALTMPAYLYFIYRKPHSFMRWIIIILPITAVILTKSRGGLIGLGIAFMGMLLFTFKRGAKINYKHIITTLSVLVVLAVIARGVLWEWIEYLAEKLPLGLDGFTSYRLFIYEHAWEIFLERPLFGSGWLSINRVFEAWLETFGSFHRLFMYHSTIFQALAAMGLFGLAALIVHYVQIFKYFLRDLKFEKSIFMIGYIATQVHGLVENVQYSVPYSILIVFTLLMFETSKEKTLFHLVDKRYELIIPRDN